MADYRIGFPSYRVFIFGLEVSSDVVSINPSYNDGNVPNQCSISLLNENNKYVITTNDIIALENLDSKKINVPWLKPDMSSRSGPDNFISDKLSNDPGVYSGIKYSMLVRKGSITSEFNKTRLDPFGVPINVDQSTRNYFGNDIKHYPICDGSTIFHAMDPVRVFFRDPYDPLSWYHMFCGFVSDISESVTENNASQVTILVEDPTKLFRYSRVALNPGILDSKYVQEEDLRLQSFWTNAYNDLSLIEIFYVSIFGPDKIGTEKFKSMANAIRSETKLSTKLRGIGHFNFDNSVIATCGTVDNNELTTTMKSSVGKDIKHIGNNLGEWQYLLDHKVKLSDIYDMASDEFRSTIWSHELRYISHKENLSSEIDSIEKVISYIGEYPDRYPVDGGRLMMLIPDSLGINNTNILIKDIISNYPMFTNFTAVGNLLFETVDRIQFSMYCSPRGDIVIEPPLFDFDPSQFDMYQTNAPDVKSGYSNDYMILKRDTMNYENSLIDSGVYTISAASSAIIQAWERQGYMSSIGQQQIVRLENLIPLYGVRVAPITDKGYIATQEGAHYYASIQLSKLNANAHTVRVSCIPNIKLWLNRPIYLQCKNVISTTKSITHNITWGASGDMTTSCNMYAARTWQGKTTSEGRLIFTSIGGNSSETIDYAKLFKAAPAPAPKPTQVFDFKTPEHKLDIPKFKLKK